MASASDPPAHPALQPADRLILPPQQPPALVETSIGAPHYPAECTSQTRSFNRACAPARGTQTLIRLHIIGKAAKTFVSPTGIRRILARAPQAAQRFKMHICEMLRFEALGQSGGVELRIMPRARDRADVHRAFDAVGLPTGSVSTC